MKELSVGLSDANAEEAANMGIACRKERRVAFMEISRYDILVKRPRHTWLLNSCSDYEVLRLFSSRIARAM